MPHPAGVRQGRNAVVTRGQHYVGSGRDEQLDYGKGIEQAGSVEAFLKNDLYNPERQMLGIEQEVWLQRALQNSKARGATWQVLGQQVLAVVSLAEATLAEQLDQLVAKTEHSLDQHCFYSLL